MNKEPCFHCDIKDLVIATDIKYNVAQIGEGLILASAEYIVLNTNYQSDIECKAFAVMEFMRALDVVLQMKNSGQKIIETSAVNKEFVQ